MEEQILEQELETPENWESDIIIERNNNEIVKHIIPDDTEEEELC